MKIAFSAKNDRQAEDRKMVRAGKVKSLLKIQNSSQKLCLTVILRCGLKFDMEILIES